MPEQGDIVLIPIPFTDLSSTKRRPVITGNLQPLCYPKGMTRYLYEQGIRIFSYTSFASPLRDEVRANAEALAKENQLEIEFIGKRTSFRKEDRIQEVLQVRGTQPGVVHIFSAMERCTAYLSWHDKKSGKTYVKSTSGKCLHYYFYFMDEDLGLCYLRVPTWCPFRLQFYLNGPNWLANQLKQREIKFEQQDNVFLSIADFDIANQVATQLDVEKLQAKLDHFAQQYCPVVKTLNLPYSWSLLQAEYATDKKLEAIWSDWDQLAEEIGRHWTGEPSAVEAVSEGCR